MQPTDALARELSSPVDELGDPTRVLDSPQSAQPKLSQLVAPLGGRFGTNGYGSKCRISSTDGRLQLCRSGQVEDCALQRRAPYAVTLNNVSVGHRHLMPGHPSRDSTVSSAHNQHVRKHIHQPIQRQPQSTAAD